MKFLLGNTDENNDSCFPNLTFNERLWGFIICVSVGYLIQILSFGSFLSLATGSPAKFAVLFSFGNIISIAGTGFLIGFKRQFASMIDDKRKLTTIVFLSSLFGTLISAILFDSRMLVFMCLVVQIPSYIWYCASYFPFAQDCIRSCLRGITSRFTGKQQLLMNRFQPTTSLIISVILAIAAYLSIISMFIICWRRKYKATQDTQSIQLNEQQFQQNIQIAKKGQECQMSNPQYVMSNHIDFQEGVPRKIE